MVRKPLILLPTPLSLLSWPPLRLTPTTLYLTPLPLDEENTPYRLLHPSVATVVTTKRRWQTCRILRVRKLRFLVRFCRVCAGGGGEEKGYCSVYGLIREGLGFLHRGGRRGLGKPDLIANLFFLGRFDNDKQIYKEWFMFWLGEFNSGQIPEIGPSIQPTGL